MHEEPKASTKHLHGGHGFAKCFRKNRLQAKLQLVLLQVPFKWTFGREPPPQIDPNLGGALFLFCISIGNVNWKKFLRWKLLDNICSSELEQNHQTKTYTCEFENFSDKFFPIFGRIETFQIVFVITSFVAKVTKVHVDAILRKKI